MARAVLAPVVAAALLFGSCSDTEDPQGGNRVQWDGPKVVVPPDPNPQGVVEFDGWEHCAWESIRFLGGPAPPVPDTSKQYLQFVRALAAELPNTVGDFDADAELPADATRTAYSEGDRSLWFSPAEGSTYAYIVQGDRVERWPRFDGGCD